MTKTKSAKKKYHILCNDHYGIYYGIVKKYNPQTRVATVAECRHVARWYGKTGGITSLAAHGICGPNASQSRIGAPVNARLTGIMNIFEVSDEAAGTIALIIPR